LIDYDRTRLHSDGDFRRAVDCDNLEMIKGDG
jgi:hypothetical protein